MPWPCMHADASLCSHAAVLYYGGAGGQGDGKKATELVPDLTTPQQLNDFVRNTPSPDTLVVSCCMIVACRVVVVVSVWRCKGSLLM
jgi:hypothetical protein